MALSGGHDGGDGTLPANAPDPASRPDADADAPGPDGSQGRRPRLSPLDRRIASLAFPALGSLAIEPLYVLTDTAIVGRLGTTPLAGLAIASTVLNTLAWAANVLSYGTTSRVAVLTGKGDEQGAASVTAQGLWLCGAIGLPIAVAVAVLAEPMARALGGTGDVLDAAVTYLTISAVGIPFLLVALLGHGWFRGLSDTKTPLRVVLVANAINVVLELLFVYGFDWGVAGSAWGTVIAQVLTAAWFLSLGIARLARPVWDEMRRLLAIGRDLFIRTAALVAVLVLSTSVAARVSDAALGGHQIAIQLFTFLALVVDALAITAQAMIGTRLGAGDVPGALAASRRLLWIGLFVGGGIGAAVALGATRLPHVFTEDPAVIDQAAMALALLGILQLPAAVAFVLDGVLMGAGDFRFLKWTTLAAGAAFVPFAVAVLRRDLGLEVVWFGLVVWMATRAAVCLARFSRPDRWTASAR